MPAAIPPCPAPELDPDDAPLLALHWLDSVPHLLGLTLQSGASHFATYGAERPYGGKDIAGAPLPARALHLPESWAHALAEDGAFVKSLMVPVTEPGQYASWIAPPRIGIDNKPGDFEYVQLHMA